MAEQTVEEAFEDHRQAQRIREAIRLRTMSYNDARARSEDDGRSWFRADEEVMDAALKYADYLESRAYHGPSTEGGST